ncbi:unnamed protein product [Rotaria sp. Silwood2]|nr:unnamed protein product [Rotaria sp. Silwood2]
MIAHSPANQPVIIITINFRLGVLADMYLKELFEEKSEWPTAGYYMYLDMLSALRWIKKNIHDYRGDPDNIALFGESAGGLSVIDLGGVKGSVNLYRTVISQSGLGSPGTYTSYYNMSQALNYSNSVVQKLNCANNEQDKVLLCLRNYSIEHLLTIYGNRYTRPIIANYFFPRYPPLAIENGMYNKDLSLIMGNNDNEIACAVKRYKGVCVHTAELPYLFGTVSDYLSVEAANSSWDNSSRIFSNEMISYWTKIAAIGRPFSQWPNYVPYTTENFYITSDQDFSTMIWNRNCLIFDQSEEQGMKEKFGNSSHTFKETFFIIKIFFLHFIFLFNKNE